MEAPAPPSGEGPGVITGDGCAVELYRRFPHRGEIDLIAPFLKAGGSVLDLGCGTGRLTRPLLEKGFAVTAVDHSADMLRHVPDEATKVHADIERLSLQRRFDAVLFSSNLINTSDRRMRFAQLAACARHLAPQGNLLFQRFDPDWMRCLRPGELPPAGELRMAVDRAQHDGAFVQVSLRYRWGDEEWRQHFTAEILDHDDIAAALSAAGLRSLRWIDIRWGVARFE